MLRTNTKIIIVLSIIFVMLTACNMSGFGNEGQPPEVDFTPDLSEDEPDGDVETEEPAATDEADEGARSVTFKRIEGDVEYRASEADDFSKPAVDDVMGVGGEIITGVDGFVVLELDDGTVITLSSESRFQLTELEGTTENPITRFFLNLGEVFAFREGQEKLPENAAFDVETPHGVAAIRGSSMGVQVRPDARGSGEQGRYGKPSRQGGGPPFILICLSGECVAVNPGGQVIFLSGGEVIEIDDLGEFSEVVIISTSEFLAGQFACIVAQGAGLLTQLRCEEISITPETEEPSASPTSTPTSTPTPTARPTQGPVVTEEIFPVYFCEYYANRDFQWYEVKVTYEDGVAVAEEIVSGPYYGTWVPGCPGNICAETTCGDQQCQPDCGENTETCANDCPAGPYCDPLANTAEQCGDGTFYDYGDPFKNYCDCSTICPTLTDQASCDAHMNDWSCYWDSFSAQCYGGGY